MTRIVRAVLTVCVVTAFVPGCGALPLTLRQAQGNGQGDMPPIGAPQISALAARTTSTNYKVLYSFGTSPDGSHPTASLIDVGGTLYGTTAGGGSNSCAYYPSWTYNGCGTVFSITPAGTEKTLYRFGTPPDGSVPYGSLLDVAGTLYGTTVYGGSNLCGYRSQPFSCGTVFTITTSGAEKVLHNFGQGSDGEYPLAGLIKLKGTLYGTTSGGGANYCAPYQYNIRCGTVFSITPGGAEGLLYSFGPGKRRANTPLASLLDARGTLYGTTRYGGKHGYGTVFSITLHSRVKVLHDFSGTDGATPLAGLIEVKGALYGTTEVGGAYDFGTVFSITPTGTERVLHSFSGGSDGSYPHASLIDVKGMLFGTTYESGQYGAGTVFSITPGGTEKVLHSFSGTEGGKPAASLIDVNGTLYGTTAYGGTHNNGTVFAFKL